MIGKWLSGKIFNYAWSKLKESLKPPLIESALSKACNKVSEEESITIYSEALTSSEGILEEESLLNVLQTYFNLNKFPTTIELVEMLLQAWRNRKQFLLDTSEPDIFFHITETEVLPIINKIALYFFNELAQIKELSYPFITSCLANLSKNKILLEAQSFSLNIDVENIKQKFEKASYSLLSWPTTLNNQRWIERKELEELLDTIESNKSSTTLLLGKPGTGKSALLAVLGQKLKEKEISILAIKADKLPSEIGNREKLKSYYELPLSVDNCLRFIAKNSKIVLIIDQLDALSELIDRRSERLNVLLNLIQNVSSTEGIHIVSSSRWFEYKHDTRLTTIKAENIDLPPLQWDEAQRVLKDNEITQDSWSEESKNLLTVPLHLKIFLDLYNRNASVSPSVSLQGLLEAIWQQRVIDTTDSEKSGFVNLLATEMAENEELWVSRAVADSKQTIFNELVSDDILIMDETEMRIGFRHQTYFDFARARSFSIGNEKISDYVMKYQDGLFIRPVLLSSLEYIRNTDVTKYHKELLALWENKKLRAHIRTLLIEFIASLENPDATEIHSLIPTIKNELTMPRVLNAMAGSKGWFEVINNGFLPEIMSQPLLIAESCILLLKSALSFDSKGVLDLIKKYWIPQAEYDNLSLNILQYLNEWNESAVEIVCVIARRTAGWGISHIAEIASQCRPELAPKIVRADLDRKLAEAEKKDAENLPPSSLPDDASIEDHAEYVLKYESLKHQKELLEFRQEWYELSMIADSSPKQYLENIWPWFIEVLSRICDAPHDFVIGFQEDHTLGTILEREGRRDKQPVASLHDAIVHLVDADSKEFISFFEANKDSPYLAVHRLLCRGLKKIVSAYPEIILEYLISDPRRLVVGDYSDCHGESRSLISTLAPYLNKDDLLVLENTILKWNRYYKEDEKWSAEDRRNRLKWNREHRLRLLRAIPEEYLSEETRKLRANEERAFPGLLNWDSRMSGGGFVGSPMSSDQMDKAKDEDIIKLFEELDDSTGWDHPRKKFFERLVGGVIQASHELAVLAEKYPDRAAKLIPLFKPGKQEIPVGHILEGLSKSTFPSDQLFSIIHELHNNGFSDNYFRLEAARALEERAKKGNGLPQEVLDLLESWLPTFKEPLPEQVKDDDDKDETETESILWGHGGIYTLPGGRDRIFDAIAQGYLSKEPQDIDGWANLIERALLYERHPDVWKSILRFMTYLFNGERQKASQLFDQVLTQFDKVKSSKSCVRDIARVIHFVPDPNIVYKWLTSYLEDTWKLGPHAFGELSLWYLFHMPDDSWVKEELWKKLNCESEIIVHRGVAAAAAYNWHSRICQHLSTQVLIALANSDDEIVQTNISHIFQYGENIILNSDMKKIIEEILKNDSLLLKATERLIEGLEHATPAEPKLINQLCNRVLDASIEQINTIGSRYTSLAEPLVSIALTLHRIPQYRDEGLMLFERLVDSNIQAAKQALDMLDRRPLAKTIIPLRRPRRRRKSQ